MLVWQEWQLLEGTVLQLVSELFMKLRQQKTDTGVYAGIFAIIRNIGHCLSCRLANGTTAMLQQPFYGPLSGTTRVSRY